MTATRSSKPASFLVMLSAIVLGAALGLGSYQPLAKWLDARWPKPAPPEIGVETVYQVVDLLQTDYIRTLDSRTLLNGALKGMRGALEEKGVKDVLLPDLPAGTEEHLKTGFADRFRRVQVQAGHKVDRAALTYAALGGLVEVVGDPYTMVLDPKQFKRLDEQMRGGNFGGVGIYLEADPKHAKRLTVVEPIEGSPAAAADVQTGDWIMAIDGESTSTMDIEAAATRIRGPVGTKVTLTLKRQGREPFQVALERKQIHVSSATSKLLPGRIGYVRLRFFGEDTSKEFAEALQKVQQQGAQALVIDLRNNGGGYINAALDVVSNFVGKGELVVSVVNPRVERNEPHRAVDAELLDLPTVVLVNRFSASASEITAGALKDHKVARLIGEKTFGKASVQSLHPLSDGGALKYTIAHYLTPNGRDIHRQGIEPDVKIEADPTNKLGSPGDKQLDEAVRDLKKQLAAATPS